MNSAEKRKYISGILMQDLSDHDFFTKGGIVWKLSVKNKYLICIRFSLGRTGDLIEISLNYGSFYAPIKVASCPSDGLFPGNGIDLDYYIRNTGIDKCLWQPGISFESQVKKFIPYFNEIFLPKIVGNNSLNEYLTKAWDLVRMQRETTYGIPDGINIYEYISAYIALEMPEKSVEIAAEYASWCKFAAEYVKSHIDIFYYENEKIVQSWINSYHSTMKTIQEIQNGDLTAFTEEIRSREQKSIETCKKYFGKRYKESI